jgi:hypothetical protein
LLTEISININISVVSFVEHGSKEEGPHREERGDRRHGVASAHALAGDAPGGGRRRVTAESGAAVFIASS